MDTHFFKFYFDGIFNIEYIIISVSNTLIIVSSRLLCQTLYCVSQVIESCSVVDMQLSYHVKLAKPLSCTVLHFGSICLILLFVYTFLYLGHSIYIYIYSSSQGVWLQFCWRPCRGRISSFLTEFRRVKRLWSSLPSYRIFLYMQYPLHV